MPTVEVPFTLGPLAEKTRVPKETLRAWLNRGLLRAIGRNEQRHPVFNSETVARVKLLRRLRNKGFEASLLHGKSDADLRKLTEA